MMDGTRSLVSGEGYTRLKVLEFLECQVSEEIPGELIATSALKIPWSIIGS